MWAQGHKGGKHQHQRPSSGAQFPVKLWSYRCVLGCLCAPSHRHLPTLKLPITLKSTLSRTQRLPRSPVLSLTKCLVKLVT